MSGLLPALMIILEVPKFNGTVKTPVLGGRSGGEKSQLSCMKKSICNAVAVP